MQILLMLALGLISLFLILLVLVQRGRGGGLAGALGGAGGSSAFGAKAGDSFTWFTIYAASAWIVLCVVAAAWSKNGTADKLGADRPAAESTVDLGTGAGATDAVQPPADADSATDSAAPSADASAEVASEDELSGDAAGEPREE